MAAFAGTCCPPVSSSSVRANVIDQSEFSSQQACSSSLVTGQLQRLNLSVPSGPRSANHIKSWRASESRKWGICAQTVDTAVAEVSTGGVKESLESTGRSRVSSGPTDEEREARARLTTLGSVMTDETVPEGHKGLHGFLYGDDGAEVHDGAEDSYQLRQGEDDGTRILKFDGYVSCRNNQKFAGVYAVYNDGKDVQYVGYSRNVVLSLKGHRERNGEITCAAVRVKMFTDSAMITRSRLDEERKLWLEELDCTPPGNAADIHLWEGVNGPGTAAMSEEERMAYEEKKLKMRKAMGENLYDDVAGESDDSKARRLRLLQATHGDDWSSVIDGQTQETLVDPRPARVSEEAPDGATSAASAEQIVSPFMRPGAPALASSAAAEAPEMTVESVDRALEAVRPYLIADGGNVEVVGVEQGIVLLRLQGACGTCPSSTATMKMGIERTLRATFGDQVVEVAQVDKVDLRASVAAVDAHLDMLRPAIKNFGGSVEVISVDSGSGVCEVRFVGPPPIGMGIQAAIQDKFPDIRSVNLLAP